MDQSPQLVASGILQPARSGDHDGSSPRDWCSRVAVPTRGTKAERTPVTAHRTGVCFVGDDLAGVVGAFPRATTDRLLTWLSLRCRISGSRYGRADRPFGWLSKRRKRARLDE